VIRVGIKEKVNGHKKKTPMNSTPESQPSTSPSDFSSYLKNLLDLKNVDDAASKQNKDIKDKIKSIKSQLQVHMESNNLKFIPVQDQYLVLKRTPSKPTISDEFIVAVVKKYMDASNLPFEDTHAINFLQVLNRCRDDLTTYQNVVVMTANKPVESLY